MVELAGIVVLGIIAQWVAWRFKLPAILPLILIGLLVGPIATLYTENGQKLIEPIWNGEQGLFPGESLYYFVSLAIGIIPVSYTHLRAHETDSYLVCRLLLEKKKHN